MAVGSRIGRAVDAGCNHRDPHDALEALVESRAEDDVRLLVHLVADASRRLVDFVELQIAAAGDRDEQTLGAAHRGFVEERVVDRVLGRAQRAALAGGLACAHHRLAHFAHDGTHVGEVEIDETFLDHQVVMQATPE